MTSAIEAVTAIDGARFELRAELDGNEVRISCTPGDERFRPLCAVVDTSWRYSPLKLIASVAAGHGQSFEGAVSFAYHADHPDELEPGVTVDYLGDELVVDEATFCGLVKEVTRFYLHAKAELKRRLTAEDEELKAQLSRLQ